MVDAQPFVTVAEPVLLGSVEARQSTVTSAGHEITGVQHWTTQGHAI